MNDNQNNQNDQTDQMVNPQGVVTNPNDLTNQDTVAENSPAVTQGDIASTDAAEGQMEAETPAQPGESIDATNAPQPVVGENAETTGEAKVDENSSNGQENS